MYEFIWLNKKLLYIKWNENASGDMVIKFVSDLYNLLNKSEVPFYMITDLRNGYIDDAKAFSRIRFLTQHKNWSGSVAFHNNPISDISHASFQILSPAQQAKDSDFSTPEEAIAFLELLEPGLTNGIDWNGLL